MKKLPIFVFAVAATAFGGGIAKSAVNCASVMRNLDAGASPQQVADTLAISMGDVKDCQDQAQVKAADESKSGATLERGKNDDQTRDMEEGRGEQGSSAPGNL